MLEVLVFKDAREELQERGYSPDRSVSKHYTYNGNADEYPSPTSEIKKSEQYTSR